MHPSRDIGFEELEVGASVRIDIDLIAAARSRLAWIPPLRIARIDDHRRLFRKHRSRVHVAKRPVIESGGCEFRDGGGRVVRMSALMPHIRVQNSDGIGRPVSRLQ